MAKYVKHAAELWVKDGPSGKHVDVIHGEVHDAGGNVLFAGPADQCAAKRYRIPTSLVPTKWNAIAEEVVGADHVWQMVDVVSH